MYLITHVFERMLTLSSFLIVSLPWVSLSFFFCHWKWIILKICSFLFTYLLTAVQDAPHPSLSSNQAQVSPTLRKPCTARETVISLRRAPTRKAALSSGTQVQCQKHYVSVEAWILQKRKALAWMIVHGRIIQTEGFCQCWSSSILALLVCDSSQDNTLQPSSYEVICIYNSGWCLCALKPSENSKSVCLCFSICRGNNIHPSQTVNGLICWIPYGILSMQRTIKMQNMTMILFLPCSFSHRRTMFQPQVVKLIPHIFIHNLARQ